MPFAKAEDMFEKLLRIDNNDTAIFRISNDLGSDVAVEVREEFLEKCRDERVYCLIDGCMVFTRDEGWKEVKTGRIFSESVSPSDADSASEVSVQMALDESLYVSHLGGHEAFLDKLKPLLDRISPVSKELVFVNDGATWIGNFQSECYSKSQQVLDFYHVSEHLWSFGKQAIKGDKKTSVWVNNLCNMLLESKLDFVLSEIEKLKISTGCEAKRTTLLSYLRKNSHRMDYKMYREKGILIGSGAIESAQRTVVQARLKLSGQQWTIEKAQNILNLRTCEMSKQWDTVINKCYNAA